MSAVFISHKFLQELLLKLFTKSTSTVCAFIVNDVERTALLKHASFIALNNVATSKHLHLQT